MTACACGAEHPDGARYYVSVADAGRVGLLAGPFDSHPEALEQVEPARRVAGERNPWSHFYAFGTVAVLTDSPRAGLLNGELGL